MISMPYSIQALLTSEDGFPNQILKMCISVAFESSLKEILDRCCSYLLLYNFKLFYLLKDISCTYNIVSNVFKYILRLLWKCIEVGLKKCKRI